MQERTTSGMNIREYCESTGIHENVYYYWQRKLREAACKELAARSQRETIASEKSLAPKGLVGSLIDADDACPPAPPGWALCETTESAVNNKTVTIEIGGFKVLAEADTDPETLTKVCRVLKSLC